jgi:hypothetical protein
MDSCPRKLHLQTEATNGMMSTIRRSSGRSERARGIQRRSAGNHMCSKDQY